MVANVTSELGTVKHGMLLKFFHCFPDNFSVFIIFKASVREFTEVDAITKNFIYFLHEVSTFLAVWTTYIIMSLWASCFICFLSVIHLSCVSFTFTDTHCLKLFIRKLVKLWIGKIVFIMNALFSCTKLQLTMFTEKFIASATF
jgi:hypothetical protein